MTGLGLLILNSSIIKKCCISSGEEIHYPNWEHLTLFQGVFWIFFTFCAHWKYKDLSPKDQLVCILCGVADEKIPSNEPSALVIYKLEIHQMLLRAFEGLANNNTCSTLGNFLLQTQQFACSRLDFVNLDAIFLRTTGNAGRKVETLKRNHSKNTLFLVFSVILNNGSWKKDILFEHVRFMKSSKSSLHTHCVSQLVLQQLAQPPFCHGTILS